MRVELLSRLIRHRRAVVLGALAAVSAAAWTYLLLGAGIEMELMGTGAATGDRVVWRRRRLLCRRRGTTVSRECAVIAWT